MFFYHSCITRNIVITVKSFDIPRSGTTRSKAFSLPLLILPGVPMIVWVSSYSKIPKFINVLGPPENNISYYFKTETLQTIELVQR